MKRLIVIWLTFGFVAIALSQPSTVPRPGSGGSGGSATNAVVRLGGSTRGTQDFALIATGTTFQTYSTNAGTTTYHHFVMPAHLTNWGKLDTNIIADVARATLIASNANWLSTAGGFVSNVVLKAAASDVEIQNAAGVQLLTADNSSTLLRFPQGAQTPTILGDPGLLLSGPVTADGTLDVAGEITGTSFTGTGSDPAVFRMDGTNGASIRLTLTPDAFTTNEIQFDIRGFLPGQIFIPHSTNRFGPTNIIVMTNGPWGAYSLANMNLGHPTYMFATGHFANINGSNATFYGKIFGCNGPGADTSRAYIDLNSGCAVTLGVFNDKVIVSSGVEYQVGGGRRAFIDTGGNAEFLGSVAASNMTSGGLSITGATPGLLALNGTNSTIWAIGSAGSNAVSVTNFGGVIHQVAAAVLVWDTARAGEWNGTNRIGAATTVVITNSVAGKSIRGTIIGEASGGSSRVVTLQPDTGQLVASLDDFGQALATSFAFTLTNGNAVEIDDEVRVLNGTNIHKIVTRQFKF